MDFSGWHWPILLLAALVVFLAADAHSHFYEPLDFSFIGPDMGAWFDSNKYWILGIVGLVAYVWWKNNQQAHIISEMLNFEALLKRELGESPTPFKRQLYANLRFYKLIALQAVDASTPKGSWVARYVATQSIPGFASDMTFVLKGQKNDIGDRLRFFGSTSAFLIATGSRNFAEACFKLEGAEGPEILQKQIGRLVESGDISAEALTNLAGTAPVMKGRTL